MMGVCVCVCVKACTYVLLTFCDVLYVCMYVHMHLLCVQNWTSLSFLVGSLPVNVKVILTVPDEVEETYPQNWRHV